MWNNIQMISFIAALLAILSFVLPIQTNAAQIQEVPPTQKTSLITKTSIPDVPFYSQFTDIKSPKWQKVGCGVASLAMVIDYYDLNTVSVNTLLNQGVALGAYLKSSGWTYKGLISLGNKYGLDGDSYDLAAKSDKVAFEQFKKYLKDGPVIASVHYKFDPKSTIPHLVVINGIDKDNIYYNDPANKAGGKVISIADFLKAWKKRFIVIRPVRENPDISLGYLGQDNI
ncbi:MAG: C39 family peptidase [bacterium]